MHHHLSLLLLTSSLAACRGDPSTPNVSTSAVVPNFGLSCVASNTASSAAVHCVRIDTRSGDILRIDYSRLPVSNGPTAAASGPPGRYQLACAATATDQRSDFYCVRLDTHSGDLMLINLLKVGQLPPAP